MHGVNMKTITLMWLGMSLMAGFDTRNRHELTSLSSHLLWAGHENSSKLDGRGGSNYATLYPKKTSVHIPAAEGNAH
jgi:hypothetical protein